MKALQKIHKGKDGVVLRDIKEPIPEDFEVKIKVHAAGICGTDIHIINDEFECSYPVTMGHEYSGTITEVGTKVLNFFPGERVISLTAAKVCGKCKYCREGIYMLCNERKSIGSGVNGAFSQYLTVPADIVYRIPENVSMDEAVLTEPLACVTRCVIERSSVKAGDYVLVSGPGAIGLLTAQVASACGGNVTVVGTSKDIDRLSLAKHLGAIETIIVDQEDYVKRSFKITNGNNFDIAYECSGAEASADVCLNLLKKSSEYVQVGLFGKKIAFDHDLALKKEISITNGFASNATSWEIALRLLKFKKVNLNPLISAKMPISEWKKGVNMVINKEAYKVLLDPR